MAISAVSVPGRLTPRISGSGICKPVYAALLVVGGLTLTLQDCRRMLGAVALGGAFIVLTAVPAESIVRKRLQGRQYRKH